MSESYKKYILIDIDLYPTLNLTERNAFSFYISLQLKFNNNIIYNPTNKKLSKLTGISNNSISKYKRILSRLNLIEYDKTNLIIKPAERDKRLYKLHLYRSLSANKLKELIELKILSNNIKKQQYIIDLKKLSKQNQTKKTKRILQKNSEYLSGGYSSDIHFSYRYAAKKINTSVNRIQRLLKSKLVETKKVYKFISNIDTFKDFKSFQLSINKFSDQYYNLVYDFKNNKIYELIGTDIRFKLNCL